MNTRHLILLVLAIFTSALSAQTPGSVDSLVADFAGGYVLGSAQQPDGKTIIIGTFSSVNGVTRNNVARLLADGTVDPNFDPNPNARVNGVAVLPDGKIVLAGFFTALQPNSAPASTTRNYIARVNTDGTLDAGFDLQVDNFVYGLAARPDGKLLLWGIFDSVLGATRHKVARLNANDTLDAGFDPNPNDFIFGAAVQGDGKVLLGGGFTSLDPNAAGAPVSRRCFARVNDNGTVDMGFDPSPDVRVFSTRQQADGKVLLSGDFSSLQPNDANFPTTRNRIARVNADGTLDTDFNPDAPDFEVNSVALQADGQVLFTGGFVTVQGTTRNRVARVAADGTLDGSFDPNLNNYALSVTLQGDGKVQLGGGFTELQPNGAPTPTARSFFARLVNTPATQTLTATDATQVLWQRGGAGTEVSGVIFEKSLDSGATWTSLGIGSRVGTTANWQLTGLSLGGQHGKLRARGFTAGGYFNGSSGLIEQTADFEVSTGFTLTPTLTAPAANLAVKSPISVTFTLPEAALAGSVKLKFDQIAASFTRTLTLATSQESAGTHTFTFDPANPVGSSAVASISPAAATLPDDSYNVTLSYQDAAGNPAAAAINTTVKIDTLTLTPTLTKPATNAVSPNPMAVQFTLPEAALAGSVRVKFDDGTNVRTLHIKDGVTSLSFEVGDPAASADVTSVDGGETIPDGTYTVTLSYQDELGNDAGSAQKTGVVVDGTAPQISIDTASPLRRAFAGALGNYTALANVTDAHPDTVEQEPEPGTTMSVGIHTITLTATDAAGNDSSATFDLDVRPLSAVNTKQLASGDAAPGAGTNGLPADAIIASFGPPAIDDAGNVAFVAKWISATSLVKKGTGLFTNTTCLAIVGGDASAIASGAKWKSFSDPVIEGGKCVCIAKLSTGASAVVCNFTGAPLEKIAITGEQAANVGDAKFKKFTTVALHGGAVGFLATLNGGTGTNKITPANDTGMWGRDSGSTLQLIFRDSFNLDGTHILGSFASFAPGSGSPGSGRGWLSQNITPPNTTTLALSLNTFTDKTKGIGFGGYGGYTFVAHTGETGTNFAPALTGATFASFRYPAMNDALQTTFYATMKVGAGGVTKADAGGIFAAECNFGGSLAPSALIARVGNAAGATGTTFSALKDPVLGQDGGIAFPATLKATKTVKGPATTTLWWKPPGEALKLLAQGGASTVGDIANAQWKSFTSLAIAGGGRGPIFAATLVPKKGDVTAATATGVWATDFTDATRLLFRTGVPNAIIAGKTLKSFTLLKATVGNMGVTRSFNDAAQVVWLAAFTDKSTAIITTEVP